MSVAAKQLGQVEALAKQLNVAMKGAQKKAKEGEFLVGEKAAQMLKFGSWAVAALLGATAASTVMAAPVLALVGAAAGASIATAGTMLERTARERADMRQQAQDFLKGCQVVMRELHAAYKEIKREEVLETQQDYRGGYVPSADLISFQSQHHQAQVRHAQEQGPSATSPQDGPEVRSSGPRIG